MKSQGLLLVFICLLASCESKEELLKQEMHEKQLALIKKKQAELEEIKKKVQGIKKPVHEPALDEVKKQIKEAAQKKMELNADFKELAKRKESAEKELRDYQKMYPLRK